jgi:SAM-dependent methyltransferase
MRLRGYAPLVSADPGLPDALFRVVRRLKKIVQEVDAKNGVGAFELTQYVEALENRLAELSDRSGAEQPASYFDAIYSSSRHYREDVTPWTPLWKHLVERVGDARTIVDLGCGPGHLAKLLQPLPIESYVGFDFSQVAIEQALARQPDPRFRFVQADLTTEPLPPADLYIACEFLEHVERDLEILEEVPAGARVLFMVPSFGDRAHVRHFANVEEAEARYDSLFELSGEPVGRWFCLAGTRRPEARPSAPLQIVRMMAVWNEADILERNLAWYADAGFPTVAVDTGSTDGSYELCRAAARDGTIIALERRDTERFEWKRTLELLDRLVREDGAEYVLLASPDEFFEVEDGSDLKRAMESDFAAGYNVLEFANMEFQVTTEDDPADPDPLTRMNYYTYRRTAMQRAYRLLPGLDAVRYYGHRLVFPDGVPARPSPRRYISRHYPLRSEAQAKSKIDRMLDRTEQKIIPVRYLRIWNDPDNLYTKRSQAFLYKGDHRWHYADKALSARLNQTEQALKNLYVAYETLRREHEAMVDRD